MRKGIKDNIGVLFTADRGNLHGIKISEGIVSRNCRNYRLLLKNKIIDSTEKIPQRHIISSPSKVMLSIWCQS
jgi:hypothetical protein